MSVLITVVGSINLDFVATGAALPSPGETVTGATLARHPGGKGANQALAAARLGASVRLIGRVGADAMADEALALLRAEGVDLAGVEADSAHPTGVALIAVSADGENQIVVAPGANAAFGPEALEGPISGALICQLELPVETVARSVALATGFVSVNLAPAMDVPDAVLDRADLLIVNETEAAWYGDRLQTARGLIAITYGARGARLLQAGAMIGQSSPPSVKAVDTTGAGDTFVAALTLALVEGMTPDAALDFACAAGAITATRPGAQPSLPWRGEVETLLGLRP
jgi:ribokinase